MANNSGIQEAVALKGSPTKLAEAVGNKCQRQHVEHWLKNGRVSVEFAPHVAAATGIALERLNDRMDWSLASAVQRQQELEAA